MAPRPVDDVDDRRVGLAALREVRTSRLGRWKARDGIRVFIERTQATPGYLRVQGRRFRWARVDDHLDRWNVEAFEVESAVDEHVDLVAAEAGDDLLALGLRSITARERRPDPGLFEERRHILRVLDGRREHERLLARHERLVRFQHRLVALFGIDRFGQLPENEIAGAGSDGVEVGFGADRIRANRNEVSSLDRRARVHLVHDVREDLAELLTVAAMRRRCEADHKRVRTLEQNLIEDRAVRRRSRVMRFVDHEQGDPAPELRREAIQARAGKGLHGRDDDRAVFARILVGLLDADAGVRVLGLELLDELLDQLVAVRDDQRDVGRPQLEQFGQGRNDDALAEPGRKRHELRAKATLARLDNRLLRLFLIWAQTKGTEIQGRTLSITLVREGAHTEPSALRGRLYPNYSTAEVPPLGPGHKSRAFRGPGSPFTAR